jgi:hypothetical protein
VGGGDRASAGGGSGNGAPMNASRLDAITKAVLYEGYMLYPYRPSAIKNRQRFNFGVLYPQFYSEERCGLEACAMQTQCLLLAHEKTQCAIRVRFLRMVARSVAKVLAPAGVSAAAGDLKVEKVERLEVDGKIYQSWQEAAEEELALPEFRISSLEAESAQWPFGLYAARETQAIRSATGQLVGFVQREKQSLDGVIECSAERLMGKLFRLTVRVLNTTASVGATRVEREDALTLALVSTHTILEARDGQFVSMIDPPDEYTDSAKLCQNVGSWPVLVGEEGQHDTMLSSPIILYDYPQIADESPGDLFDGAEIDEILSLRIMTMTDEEKREMRDSDERARQILERTDTLPEDQLMKLHGALRGLRRAREQRHE